MNNTDTNTSTDTANAAPVAGVISNEIRFGAYDPKSPVASEEFRVAKCMYKGKKDPETGKLVEAEHKNSCALVPFITSGEITKAMEALTPHFITYLEGVQDEIVKKLHISGVDKFTSNSISIGSILSHLEAVSSTGNRLNAIAIGEWFDTSMADELAVAVANKMGVSDSPSDAEIEKIQLITSTYRTKLGKLASGKTFFNEDEAERIQKAIRMCKADSSVIGKRFDVRLQKMIDEGAALSESLLEL